MRKYRIVTDRFAGYELQSKVWWFPFWLQVDGINTNLSINAAKDLMDKRIKGEKKYRFKSKVVWP